MKRLTEQQRELVADNIDIIGRHIRYMLRKGKIRSSEIDCLTGFLEYQLCMAAMSFEPAKGIFKTWAIGAMRYGEGAYFRYQSHYKDKIMSIGDYEPYFDQPEQTPSRFDISFLLDSLPDKERRIVKESLTGSTSTQIARKLHYTREWIRVLYSRAVDDLKLLVAERSLQLADFER